MSGASKNTTEANAMAMAAMCGADPILTDVQAAIDVVPNMTPNTILTSGAPLEWSAYTGGQRAAIIGGALFEGLASDVEDAESKLRAGTIHLDVCHDYGCIGSLAGIYSASMPVFVVKNVTDGNQSFCNLFEGKSPHRLNYGVYNDEVRTTLQYLKDTIAPTLRKAVLASGGIPLRPIMRRALHMGDELHSRNTAATLLFNQALFPTLIDLAEVAPDEVRELLNYLRTSDYFFLRLSMAASKATADAAHNIEHSSVVTAMAFNCHDFSIRVSGLGSTWFESPLPPVAAKLSQGFTNDDIEYMGGESTINETVGLGGFAQAAAFPLQDFQGGSPERMIEMNLAMYQITLGEHPELKIPYLGFRGVPLAIDIYRVVETGVTPVMDIGVAGKNGGQIGAGVLTAPIACFEFAVKAFQERYKD